MLEQIAVMSIAFIGSFLLAKLVLGLKKEQKSHLEIPEGTKLKVLTPSGAYRCFVETANQEGIVVSAPIHRDVYVPLRVGELVVVQVSHAGGLQTFQSRITNRNNNDHLMTLEWPKHVRLSDRRSSPRVIYSSFESSQLNKKPSKLIDLAEMGAKMVSQENLMPGDWVNVQLPDSYGQVYGWVLDTSPSRIAGLAGNIVRVRFENPITLLSARLHQ